MSPYNLLESMDVSNYTSSNYRLFSMSFSKENLKGPKNYFELDCYPD